MMLPGYITSHADIVDGTMVMQVGRHYLRGRATTPPRQQRKCSNSEDDVQEKYGKAGEAHLSKSHARLPNALHDLRM